VLKARQFLFIIIDGYKFINDILESIHSFYTLRMSPLLLLREKDKVFHSTQTGYPPVYHTLRCTDLFIFFFIFKLHFLIFYIYSSTSGCNGIFSRRLDFSSFNLLPKTRLNSYQVKVSYGYKIYLKTLATFIRCKKYEYNWIEIVNSFQAILINHQEQMLILDILLYDSTHSFAIHLYSFPLVHSVLHSFTNGLL